MAEIDAAQPRTVIPVSWEEGSSRLRTLGIPEEYGGGADIVRNSMYETTSEVDLGQRIFSQCWKVSHPVEACKERRFSEAIRRRSRLHRSDLQTEPNAGSDNVLPTRQTED
jgi:hypothetical protein